MKENKEKFQEDIYLGMDMYKMTEIWKKIGMTEITPQNIVEIAEKLIKEGEVYVEKTLVKKFPLFDRYERKIKVKKLPDGVSLNKWTEKVGFTSTSLQDISTETKDLFIEFMEELINNHSSYLSDESNETIKKMFKEHFKEMMKDSENEDFIANKILSNVKTKKETDELLSLAGLI